MILLLALTSTPSVRTNVPLIGNWRGRCGQSVENSQKRQIISKKETMPKEKARMALLLGRIIVTIIINSRKEMERVRKVAGKIMNKTSKMLAHYLQ